MAADTPAAPAALTSILHGGYHHPLSRKWQASRQLTKACPLPLTLHPLLSPLCPRRLVFATFSDEVAANTH